MQLARPRQDPVLLRVRERRRSRTPRRNRQPSAAPARAACPRRLPRRLAQLLGEWRGVPVPLPCSGSSPWTPPRGARYWAANGPAVRPGHSRSPLPFRATARTPPHNSVASLTTGNELRSPQPAVDACMAFEASHGAARPIAGFARIARPDVHVAAGGYSVDVGCPSTYAASRPADADRRPGGGKAAALRRRSGSALRPQRRTPDDDVHLAVDRSHRSRWRRLSGSYLKALYRRVARHGAPGPAAAALGIRRGPLRPNAHRFLPIATVDRVRHRFLSITTAGVACVT
jgi:hypothetical protein